MRLNAIFSILLSQNKVVLFGYFFWLVYLTSTLKSTKWEMKSDLTKFETFESNAIS